MKSQKLYDAITEIDDDLIEAAAPKQKKTPRKKIWYTLIAACLIVAIGASTFCFGRLPADPPQEPGALSDPAPGEAVRDPVPSAMAPGDPPVPNAPTSEPTYRAYTLAAASYPIMAQYPKSLDDPNYWDDYINWSEGRQDQILGSYRSSGLITFLQRSIPEIMTGAEGENRIYSPLNVYMALAMLAETCDGNSRQQLLELLGAEDLDTLRTQATYLWNANYCDDGTVTSLLASSLWLDESVEVNQATAENLAEFYFASTFRGQMGTAAYNTALQSWLNDNTGNLLTDQIENLQFDSQTIMALATTVYYRAQWSNKFSELTTTQDLFHAAAGDMYCDFMHASVEDDYYWGEHFSAVRKSLEYSGDMWFILPDEDVHIDTLLNDQETMGLILSDGIWKNQKRLTINLAIPKFDVSSQIDLVEDLQKLGITDVFDGARADFSPITPTFNNPVSAVTHGARVRIDEEGCEATAYTIIPIDGAPEPQDDEIDFVLDRPFIFIITNEQGLPLFVGTVQQPH